MNARLWMVAGAWVLASVLVACSGSKSSEKPATEGTTAAQKDGNAAPGAALTCDLWKQDCPAGQQCSVASGTGACVPEGTAAEGAACQTGNDCGKGLFCTSKGCRRMCDADHACPKGECVMFDNNTALGACSEAAGG